MQRLTFKPRTLIALILPAIFTAVMAIIMYVAFASLIFSGPLAVELPKGIALLVAGGVFAGIFGSIFSRSRQIVFQTDDDTAPIYAAMVAAVLLALPLSLSPEQALLTVVLSILLATLFSGITLALLGQLKVGAIVEFLPYSVMGGYFATAGWLLAVGAISVGAGATFSSLDTVAMVISEKPLKISFTVCIGFIFFALRNHLLQSILVPLVGLLAVIFFYGAVMFSGISLESIASDGWLIGPFPNDPISLFNPMLFDLLQTDWHFLLSGGESLLVIVLLSVISMLLTVSGLSLITKEDIEVNHELKVVGLTNIANAFVGGMAALPSLSLTALSESMGAPKTRWLGISVAIFTALIFYFLIEYIGYLPRPVVGGLLLSLGLKFLHEWLIEAKSKYDLYEYLVIPTILFVAAFFGFIQGVLVGLLAAVVLFVVKYSQINVIRFDGDGSRFRSNVERSKAEQAYLNKHSDSLFLMGLQGYLFFGTAGRIYNRLKLIVENGKQVRYIILDFEQVTGIDASAGLNFEKLSQLVTLKQVYLIVAGLDDGLKQVFSNSDFSGENVEFVLFEQDLDHALEWCEERQLLSGLNDADNAFQSFSGDLQAADPPAYKLFLSYLKEIKTEKGYVLAKQGEKSDQLFLLDTTSASAYINDEKGNRLRVRRASQGTVYGEIGFFLGTPRTASIVTDEAGRVYVLTREAFTQMEDEHPEIVARFQKYLLALSIERLFLTTQTLKTVLR